MEYFCSYEKAGVVINLCFLPEFIRCQFSAAELMS